MGMEMIGFPCPFCIDFSAGGMNMDSMDRSILKCLSENSRQSATEISQTVHLSVAAVIERIRKLERNGIILIFPASVHFSLCKRPVRFSLCKRPVRFSLCKCPVQHS